MSEEHDYNIDGSEGPGAQITAIAKMCHEANRALQDYLGEEQNPPWDEAPDWMKESSAQGVKVILEEGLSPRQSHENWSEHRMKDGWTYGPVKDEEAKTHPCLVSYDELPYEQQVKDALFGSVVRMLHPEGPSSVMVSYLVVVDEEGQAVAAPNALDHLRFTPRREAEPADIERSSGEVHNDIRRFRDAQESASLTIHFQRQMAVEVMSQQQQAKEMAKAQALISKGGHLDSGGRPRG